MCDSLWVVFVCAPNCVLLIFAVQRCESIPGWILTNVNESKIVLPHDADGG